MLSAKAYGFVEFNQQKPLPWNPSSLQTLKLSGDREREFHCILYRHDVKAKRMYLKGRSFWGRNLTFFLSLRKEGQNGREVRVMNGLESKMRGQNGQNFCLKIAHPRKFLPLKYLESTLWAHHIIVNNESHLLYNQVVPQISS